MLLTEFTAAALTISATPPTRGMVGYQPHFPRFEKDGSRATLELSSAVMGPEAKHAFISYVGEDTPHVKRLCRVLEAAGVPYWRDRQALGPGDEWKRKIREAIRAEAMVFFACFSDQSRAKNKSYMNEELTLAVDEYRKRPPGAPWLIPIRFDEGDVPDWDLGAGRTLHDLNYVNLFGDGDEYTENAIRLVLAVKAAMAVPSLEPPTIRAAVEKAVRWPGLGPLVDSLESDLRATDGVTVEKTEGALIPRLVATAGGTRYGLYVMDRGGRPSQKWLDQAIDGAAKVGDDVRPALVLQDPPTDWLSKAAAKRDVLVIWRSDDGQWHNAPWLDDQH